MVLIETANDICWYFSILYLFFLTNCNVVGGENQVAINLIVKHVHLKLQEVHDIL